MARSGPRIRRRRGPVRPSCGSRTTSTGSARSTRRSTSTTVDFTVHDPDALSARFGHVLDYMARVELEVDRNVLELITMLPDPPEVDRHFYADVWQPQEIRHGLILDELQTRHRPSAGDAGPRHRLRQAAGARRAGSPRPASRTSPGCSTTSPAWPPSAPRCWPTTCSTTASSRWARRPSPRPSSRRSAARSPVTTRSTRCRPTGSPSSSRPGSAGSYAACASCPSPRSASTTPTQRADFGDVMETLGITDDVEDFTETIARVERELLWAQADGMRVPPYVLAAFRDAVERPPSAARPDRDRQPARAQPPSTCRAIQARPAAVRSGEPRRLHDVAEHDPHDHVDGRRRAGAASGRGRRPAPAPRRRSWRSRAGCRVRGQQRQQLGVGAVRGGDDRVQQRVVLGQDRARRTSPPRSRRACRRGAARRLGRPPPGSGRARPGSSPRPARSWCRSRCRRSAG